MVIGVDDAVRAAGDIRAAGGRIFREPADIPGTGRFAVAADPQGAAFGILAIFFGSLAEGKYQDALITPFAMLPFPFGFWLFHKLLFKNDVDKALRFLRSIGFVHKP